MQNPTTANITAGNAVLTVPIDQDCLLTGVAVGQIDGGGTDVGLMYASVSRENVSYGTITSPSKAEVQLTPIYVGAGGILSTPVQLLQGESVFVSASQQTVVILYLS